MTEEEKQLIETAKAIIERDEEKQLLKSARTIVENNNEISGLAIASMVVGIISTIIFTIICGPLSIILGCCALRSEKKGKGMAWAGIITGTISIILYLILLVIGVISF